MSFARYEKYKGSGVEWLGEVPAHWSVLPLKVVATCNDDVLPETTDGDTEIEYVEISGVEEGRGIFQTDTLTFGSAPSRARRIVRSGDILISTVRTYLRAIATVSQAPPNLIASTGFAAIRPRSVHDRFLGYLLHCEFLMSEVVARSVGISYPAINASDLMCLKGPFPTNEEQLAIATFLDHETAKIDALVEEQKRLIELLKEKRQAVISHAVTKGLNPNAPMKDSGVEWLGKVPAHWEVSRLKQLATSIKAGPFGSAITKDMYVGEGYRVFGQEQVIPNDFSVGNYYIDAKKFDELRQYETVPGDILISCVGTFGRVAVVPDGVEAGVINPRLIRLRCSIDVDPAFLAEILRSDVVFEQFAMHSRGGTMDVINIGTLSDVVLAVPGVAEQSAVLSRLARETGQIGELVQEAQTAILLLGERRTALISAAVTGKIDVRSRVNQKALEAA